MRVVVSEFTSLDGVCQAPGGAEEDLDGGFAHGGWSMPYFDPEVMGAAVGDAMATTEVLLFGRRTWQVMAAAWPERAGDPFADRMNSIEKHVVSATLTEADLTWSGSHLVAPADLPGLVQGLRDRPGGDAQVMGSLTLARSLLGAGLVDELRLMVEPIALGGGKRLWPDDGVARRFDLVSSAVAATGVLVCAYRASGSA